jgi:hypothetical protein
MLSKNDKEKMALLRYLKNSDVKYKEDLFRFGDDHDGAIILIKTNHQKLKNDRDEAREYDQKLDLIANKAKKAAEEGRMPE